MIREHLLPLHVLACKSGGFLGSLENSLDPERVPHNPEMETAGKAGLVMGSARKSWGWASL